MSVLCSTGRSDTLLSGTTAMLFLESDGEHSITTRELYINDMSVVQFDVSFT